MAQLTLSNIMVVDDDPDILSQMEKIFTKLKAESVKTFTSGQALMKELEATTQQPDCVFIDVKMPVMSGAALIQHIRNHKDKNIKNIFCIPIVGRIDKEETVILQELNCFETIIKPIEERVFLKRFKELADVHNDPESEKNFLLTFNNALLEKQFKQAEASLLPKIKKEPNSVRYLAMYAELLMKSKLWPKAEEFLTKILKIDSNYIPALNLMSKVCIKQERFEDAMVYLEKAKNLSPLHIERLLVIGEMNLGSGNAEQAEESFRTALRLNPIEEKAAFGLGRALATQGKIEESKKVLASLQNGAELASFFNNKGILLVRAKRVKEGIDLYQNALQVLEKERQYLILYNIALAYSKLNEYDSAIEFAKKSQEQAPKGYVKVKNLIERLEKEKAAGIVPAKEEIVATDSSKQEFLLTNNQVEFMMIGFEEEKPKEAPKQEEEFISFGLD